MWQTFQNKQRGIPTSLAVACIVLSISKCLWSFFLPFSYSSWSLVGNGKDMHQSKIVHGSLITHPTKSEVRLTARKQKCQWYTCFKDIVNKCSVSKQDQKLTLTFSSTGESNPFFLRGMFVYLHFSTDLVTYILIHVLEKEDCNRHGNGILNNIVSSLRNNQKFHQLSVEPSREDSYPRTNLLSLCQCWAHMTRYQNSTFISIRKRVT